jgi:thymidylate synthase (FAD)
MLNAEHQYNLMIEYGATPQNARSVLPNSLMAEIVVTANLREWRHILRLRTSKKAHPDMRFIMLKLLTELKIQLPAIFGDIYE